MNTNTLHEKIENSKPVDFGTIFSKSIELFKKVWSEGLVHVLLGMAIMFPRIQSRIKRYRFSEI